MVGMVVGSYQPQLQGDAQIGDHWPGQPRHVVRPYLKNNQYKKDWQSGSSDSLPT
jgi:hypothetical protein